MKRKTLALSGIEHLTPGSSAPKPSSPLQHPDSTLRSSKRSLLFKISRPKIFLSPVSIIAICELNVRYTYLILFDETQRNVCKNLRVECALAREFRDAGTLPLFFLLDFLCVASVFQDPAYKWNLSYRGPRHPTPPSYRRLHGSHLSFYSLDVRTYPDTCKLLNESQSYEIHVI